MMTVTRLQTLNAQFYIKLSKKIAFSMSALQQFKNSTALAFILIQSNKYLEKQNANTKKNLKKY